MTHERPNVLVVMFDQVAPSALGAYGNPVTHAPTVDHLARTGVVFDAAYSNSPLCTPARYCMMTGQLPSATGGYDNAAYLPSTIPTMAHVARTAGYRTILDGKMHFVGADQLHGFEERRTTDIYPADFGWTPNWLQPDERVDWWMHNMDSVTQSGIAEVTNQLSYDDEVGHQGIRALHDCVRDQEQDERPWMLVVSFTHPHDPYVTRRKYWDLYEGKDIPLPSLGKDDVALDPPTARLRHVSAMDEVEITDADVRSARRAYYGNISYLDEWTSRLLSTLDALEVRDDTIVILLADHGDMLGERGLWYKMNFFEDSARIPMIVNAPTRFAAKRVSEPVSLVDIYPTIFDLGGDSSPAGVDPLPGRSLLPLIDGTEAPGTRREVIGEYMGEGAIAPIVMIRRGDLKYVHSPVDPDQLYDLAADPHERVNLAEDSDWDVPVKELRMEVERRWDMDALTADVVKDQSRRRLVDTAMRRGRPTPWEYTPPADGSQQFMRNHMDLNDVESGNRYPRYNPFSAEENPPDQQPAGT